MSLSTFIKLVGKAFRFTISRPLQRFNIYNRSKPHIGPDADEFLPAPRAIGPMANSKPKQYPHLEGITGGGLFKSVKQKRLEALQAKGLLKSANDDVKFLTENKKSYSESESDDRKVIEASSKLEVTKTVRVLEDSKSKPKELPEGAEKGHRPLPTSTNLDLSNPASIWQIDKVPMGRLSLDQLQEIMLNKLADDAYWTPKAIAEKYNIKEEYARNLIDHYKQIRIVMSPRMYKLVEYTGRENPLFQATKHLVYFVDKNLRNDMDRKFDKMFLPTDELDPEIRELIDTPTALEPKPKLTHRVEELLDRPKRFARKAEPLRLRPANAPGPEVKQIEQRPIQLENRKPGRALPAPPSAATVKPAQKESKQEEQSN